MTHINPSHCLSPQKVNYSSPDSFVMLVAERLPPEGEEGAAVSSSSWSSDSSLGASSGEDVSTSTAVTPLLRGVTPAQQGIPSLVGVIEVNLATSGEVVNELRKLKLVSDRNGV